jgi:hypothetical protein
MRYALVLAALACLIANAQPLHAAQMYRLDLQSLAYLSSDVIEGDVTADETVHWVDKLTLNITHVYAGDLKAGDAVVVGLSAYAKTGKDQFDFRKYEKGDHLLLFIEPVTQQSWKDDKIPYWPVCSGLKLFQDGKVTGVIQEENPGAYINTVDEGTVDACRDQVTAAVKWAAAFRSSLKEHRADVPWLLQQLKSRPEIKKETWGMRDYIAALLCQEIGGTNDAEAINAAREMRQDYYERQMLDLKAPATQPAAQ